MCQMSWTLNSIKTLSGISINRMRLVFKLVFLQAASLRDSLSAMINSIRMHHSILTLTILGYSIVVDNSRVSFLCESMHQRWIRVKSLRAVTHIRLNY